MSYPQSRWHKFWRWIAKLPVVFCTAFIVTGVLHDRAGGNPVISEFMASNDGVISDEDGDFSDWIEIFNPGVAEVDLDGFFLSDAPGNPSKWRLPSLVIPGGEFIVVFASGKDRAISGSELHTNFQLNASGDYLALIAEDGATVLSEFGPGIDYPRQRPDISYGIATTIADALIIDPEIANARYLVPMLPAELDQAWKTLEFDDGDWNAGGFGVGFDLAGGGATNVTLVGFWPLDEGTGTISANLADSLFPGSLVNMGDGSGFWTADVPPIPNPPDAALTFDGTAAYLGTTYPGLGGSQARSVSFWIKTSDTSDHGIVAWGDSTSDGKKWHIRVNDLAGDGTVGAIRVENQGGRVVGSQVITNNQWHHVAIAFPDDGSPDVTDTILSIDGTADQPSGSSSQPVETDISGPDAAPLSIGRRTQGANESYFSGQLSQVALFSGALDADQVASLASGTNAPSEVLGYDSLLATDLEAAMHTRNASVFVRTTFNLAPGTDYDQLRLRMQYDDGFIAYLNGVEVARANAPAVPTWNSIATASHSDGAALAFEEFNVSAHLALLQTGPNVLAIHLLNKGRGDGDLLLVPQLIGQVLGANPIGYFESPSPGEPNGPLSGLNFVADTEFSVDRGFFDRSFELAITSATPDAEIYYTTNGSAPAKNNGTLYTAPFRIRTTTVVRAIGLKEGLIPTNIDTQTYIFPKFVIRQPSNPRGYPLQWDRIGGTRVSDYEMDPDVVGPIYTNEEVIASLRSLPTISMVMSIDDLFDPDTGFYTNPQQRGDRWEKPCSLEFFDFPDGASTQLNAGIRCVGRASRNPNRNKHNLRAVFRREYGPKKLNFPLLDDTKVTTFNSLILRGGNGDSWINPGTVSRAQYIRDQWHRDVQAAMGQPHQAQIYAHFYINGMYWGVYHVFERFEDDMLAEHFGGNEEDWDVIKDAGSAGNLEIVDGSLSQWQAVLTLSNRNVASPNVYAALQEYIHVDSYIDYFLMNFYSGNTDWDTSNWRAARRKGRGAPWMLFAWDSERTDRNATQGTNSSNNNVTGKDVSNFPSHVHQRLTTNAEYRMSFADRVHRHFFNNGVLSPRGAAALWDARADEIYEALIAESARWGDLHRSIPATREDPWQGMLDTMHSQFFPQRTGIVLNQLKARNLYPDVDAPTFSQHGGRVSENYSLSMRAGAGTIYYTLDGTDPRRPATPNTVAGVAAGAQTYTGEIVLPTSTTVKARFLQGDEWSALSEALFLVGVSASDQNLVISEIMSQPIGGSALEFVELTNISNHEIVDLTGVSFDEGIDFTFPDTAQLDPGERILVVASTTEFEIAHGSDLPIAGEFNGGTSLNNGGEEILLVDAQLGTPRFLQDKLPAGVHVVDKGDVEPRLSYGCLFSNSCLEGFDRFLACHLFFSRFTGCNRPMPSWTPQLPHTARLGTVLHAGSRCSARR